MLLQATMPIFPYEGVAAALPVRSEWEKFFVDAEEYEARGFVYVHANLPPVQRTYADSVMTLAAIDYKDSSLNNWADPTVVTTSQWHMAFKGVVSQLNVQGETPTRYTARRFELSVVISTLIFRILYPGLFILNRVD